MPIFEYRCPECSEEFDLLETIVERDKPKTCPSCGATRAKRILSVFSSPGKSAGAKSCGPGTFT